ncbi:HNH endonuclease [Xanthomonas phage Xop411]|uniref:p53 n=1 Tax=Xanthomonas phage Xop411 TaxID=2913975 RepID=A5H1J3_9CAUD|nr:HNH endonuclease [Xanthomonas phage Xop411]ABK00197.1 p53 [Xanthomonas phage Xop411]
MSKNDFNTGAKNKFWPQDHKWRARIKLGGKELHLGYFKSFDEAIAARAAAKVVFQKLTANRDR